jgi:hypothetical protein
VEKEKGITRNKKRRYIRRERGKTFQNNGGNGRESDTRSRKKRTVIKGEGKASCR